MEDLLRVAERLDGLPLALELAAARLRLFSAGQLADRLDDLLGTLDAGGPNTAEIFAAPARYRHSTLRATVNWSYRTLPAGRGRRCCGSSRCSPARWTWPRWSGSPVRPRWTGWPCWSTSRSWSPSRGPPAPS